MLTSGATRAAQRAAVLVTLCISAVAPARDIKGLDLRRLAQPRASLHPAPARADIATTTTGHSGVRLLPSNLRSIGKALIVGTLLWHLGGCATATAPEPKTPNTIEFNSERSGDKTSCGGKVVSDSKEFAAIVAMGMAAACAELHKGPLELPPGLLPQEPGPARPPFVHTGKTDPT